MEREGPSTIDHFFEGGTPPPEREKPSLLSNYLRDTYLAKAISNNRSLATIPEKVDQILAPLLTAEHLKSSDGSVKCEIMGSVARHMALNPLDTFWKYPRFFQEEADSEQDYKAKEVLRYLAHGPADIDIVFDPLEDRREDFGALLYNQLSELANKGRFAVDYDPETNRLYSDRFSLDDLEASFNYGQIETNPALQNFEIVFYDPNEPEEKLFLIHLSYATENAKQAYLQKRLGETCDKQDLCTIALSSDGNQLIYTVGQEQKDLMKKLDKFSSIEGLEGRSAVDLAEIALRSLRINLLHPINGSVPNVEKNDFFSLVESYWLLVFRKVCQNLTSEGKDLSKSDYSLVAREFFLCLTINPYFTIQFLRDSNLGLLIPGLSGMTFNEWNDILHLTSQIERYRQGGLRRRVDRGKRGSFMNGAEMFVEALEEKDLISPSKNSHWLKLLKLFSEDEVEEKRGQRFGSNSHEYYLSLLRNESLPEKWEDGADIEVVSNQAHLVEIIDIMSTCPAGLTVGEIARQFKLGSKEEFKKQFFLLKLSGCIRRARLKRLVERKDGREVVPLDIYSLASFNELKNIKRLDELIKDQRLMRYLQERYAERYGPDSGVRARRYVNTLSKARLSIFDALTSLTDTDFKVTGGIRGFEIKSAIECYEKLQELLSFIRAYPEQFA